jgi:hypothetical protein
VLAAAPWRSDGDRTNIIGDDGLEVAGLVAIRLISANVFCAVEPKAGRHFTFAMPDRSGPEFAQVAVHLALQYPTADHSPGGGQSQHSPSQIID